MRISSITRIDEVTAVTKEDVQRVANKYLVQTNRTVVITSAESNRPWVDGWRDAVIIERRQLAGAREIEIMKNTKTMKNRILIAIVCIAAFASAAYAQEAWPDKHRPAPKALSLKAERR